MWNERVFGGAGECTQQILNGFLNGRHVGSVGSAMMWVKEVFKHLANATSSTNGGAPRDEAFAVAEPWLALASELGATPRQGPLSHDWLLPSPRRPQRFGLNVFARDASMATTVRESLSAAARALDVEVPLLVSPDACDHDLRWHGGMVWDANQPSVKAYVSGPWMALDALGLPLGVTVDDDVFAVGFDVGRGGVVRARVYRRAHAVRDVAWKAFLLWMALAPAGLSHRVIARLDASATNEAAGKTSFDHIFGPEAELPALLKVARDVAGFEPLATSCLDNSLLDALGGVAKRHSLRLRPVSYEVDVFDDGTCATDALVTLGAS